MRFVWAVVAFVLATVMIGAGVAQRTVLQGPRTESRAIEIPVDSPYVVIDGEVLTSHSGSQTLRARGDGEILAVYGRTTDMTAWLARSDYVQVTVDDGEIVSRAVAAEPGATTDGAAEIAPLDPLSSDLWLDVFRQDDLLMTSVQLPSDMSLLVATDGVEPAPSDLTLTWPTGVTTPWAGPLIVGGGILMLIGLVLYYLGVRHLRRSRGPRRKGTPLPPTEPIEISAADKGVISATPRRRGIGSGRRTLVALPIALVSALAITGCSPDAWPDLAGTPSPSPSETVVAPEGQGAPAVTEAQAQRILTRISEQVATADAAIDATAAAERLEGAALAARETNYRLRTALPDQSQLPAIPAEELQFLLPEAYDGWPRVFFAVVEPTPDDPAVVMSIAQQDPWSNYKLTYIATLGSETNLNLAPAYVGALRIDPASPFLLLPPAQLAAAYADVLDKGDDSEYAPYFDRQSDSFRTRVEEDRARRLEDFNRTGAETGELTHQATPGESDPVALATLDSGAIVAVTVYEHDTVTSTNEDAVIKLEGNLVVSTLAGVEQSPKGFTTTYQDQLFFFIPAQSSTELIQFLGVSSQILDAKEIE
ncbi:hypothetical protein [Microbacterium sp. No. 7]|uniref:hypothetical protein n=1 Tax=Microbacterium sp. No. 7 TaxID=1714373 RepID=UPI0006D2485B|nr:hypothetical protein [Microbacterium sp. No. 7]ALJ20295.1 glycosyl transferase [Microbacterium sp. No. 7]